MMVHSKTEVMMRAGGVGDAEWSHHYEAAISHGAPRTLYVVGSGIFEQSGLSGAHELGGHQHGRHGSVPAHADPSGLHGLDEALGKMASK